MKTITVSVLVLVLVHASAQAQFSNWYVTSALDHPYALDTCGQDGYIIGGETIYPALSPTPNFPTLTRIDQNGNLLWSKKYRYQGTDESFHDVTSAPWESPDQFAAVGFTRDDTFTHMDDFLVIANLDGTVAHAKKFYSHGADIAQHIEAYDFPTLGRGYIIAGNTNETSSGSPGADNDIHVIRTDVDGNLIASAVFAKPLNQVAYSITPTSDQGFLLVGHTELSGSCEPDVAKILLVKLNSNLDIVFDRAIDLILNGGYSSDFGYVVREEANQDIHIAGTSVVHMGGAGSRYEAFQLHLNPNATFSWAKSYALNSSSDLTAISMIKITLSDGSPGYALGGNTNVTSSSEEAMVFQTDNAGDFIRGKTYHSNNGLGSTDSFKDMTGNKLDGYSFTGWAYSPISAGSVNLHLVETNVGGSTEGDCESNMTLTGYARQACIRRLGLQLKKTIMQEINVPVVVISTQPAPVKYSCGEEVASLSQISPNPAQNTVSISGVSQGEVLIYDLQGVMKKRTSFNENDQIDIADLPEGLYIVKVVDNKKRVHEFRFVKR